MAKIHTSSFCIMLAFLAAGYLSAIGIAAYLVLHGHAPVVHLYFREETMMLVKVIGKCATILCIVPACSFVVYGVSHVFFAPHRAFGSFARAAAVVALAGIIPLLLGSLTQTAIGANPFR